MRFAIRKRWIWVAVAALAATAATAVAFATSAHAIANGETVSSGYAFNVRLTMTGIPKPDGTTYDSACSGALVARQWVLTAGHCFHDVNRNRVSGKPVYASTTATIGRTNLTQTSGHVLTVVYAKQDWSADIALAKLSAPVLDVRPIALSRTAPTKGEIVRLVGWGATASDGSPSNQLHTGQFTVSSFDGEYVYVSGYKPSTSTSACPYDSGGPYFSQASSVPVLVGVESGGPDCPHTGAETTSRVDTNATWILNNV